MNNVSEYIRKIKDAKPVSMDDINKYIDALEPLSEIETELNIKLMFEGDVSARTKLIEHHLYIIREYIERYYKDVSPEEYNTLFEAGLIALIKSIDNYALEGNRSFKRFVSYRCFRALTNSYNGRYPDANVKVKDDEAILVPSDDMYEMKINSSNRYDFTKSVNEKDEIASLKSLIATLTPEEQSLVEMRFYDNMTIVDIAVSLGIGRETVTSKLEHIINKLRNRLFLINNQAEEHSLELMAKLIKSSSLKTRRSIKEYDTSEIQIFLNALKMFPEKEEIMTEMYLGINRDYPMTTREIGEIFGCTGSFVGSKINKTLKDLQVVVGLLDKVEKLEDISFQVMDILINKSMYYVKFVRLLPKSSMTLLNDVLDTLPYPNALAVKMYLNFDGYEFKTRSDVTQALTRKFGIKNGVELINKTLEEVYEIMQEKLSVTDNKVISL